MIVAALCIALGGVSFEKVDIPGLYVSPAYPPHGVTTMHARHADIDTDGHVDLLLPTRVYLRQDGRLEPDRFIEMPDVPPQSRVDVWENRVYVLSPSMFAAYELQDSNWNQMVRIDFDWEPLGGFHAEITEGEPSIQFERFLQDVDGDRKPEIVRVGKTGIVIGVIQTDRIDITNLDLSPTPRLTPRSGRDTFWPKSERKISFPNRRARFNVVIEEDSAVVVEQILHGSNEVSFGVHRYQIVSGANQVLELQQAKSHQTGSLPIHVEPFALNEDDTIDYAGYYYEKPTYGQWKPLVRSFASTDGGKTLQVATTRGFHPRALFIDLDGDGDRDWMGEESGLVTGGLRETANRVLFQRKFSHTVMARMQDKNGTFESKWRRIGRFTIRLDEPARQYTYRFWQYMNGDLLDCTGDFNGDGWRDALVYGTPESVSIYLGGPDGFNPRAETEFGVPPHVIPFAIDIDGDGLSDVAVREHSFGPVVETYLNRGSTR